MVLIPDEQLMRLALSEAGQALSEAEVPVGAVLALPDGRVFPGHNMTAALGRPSAHAEHIAIEKAAGALSDWRLEGSVLVSTVEPCLMCGGLAVLARVSRIVFGAPDPRFGAFGSVTDITAMGNLNHYPTVTGGLMAEEAGSLVRSFFRSLRAGRAVPAPESGA